MGESVRHMTWEQLMAKQPIVTKTLMNGMKKDHLAHAYLFHGFKGTGKKDIALQLAMTYFCQHRDSLEPCHQCGDCRRIESGNHPDVIYVKPDGLSIKKQQVTDLIKEFSYRGVESTKKLFIIEQAEKMTAQAANSLLKFIEEPHQQTIAILMTEQVQHMLDTIISRCQVLAFTHLSSDDIEKALIEQGITKAVARLGSVLTYDIDEALSMCREEWFATIRNIVIKLMQGLTKRVEHPLFTIYEDYEKSFEDIKQAELGLDLILFWYKDLLNLHLGEEDKVIFNDQLDSLSKQVLHSSLQQLTEGIKSIFAAKQRLSANVNHLAVIEQLVLRLQGGIYLHV